MVLVSWRCEVSLGDSWALPMRLTVSHLQDTADIATTNSLELPIEFIEWEAPAESYAAGLNSIGRLRSALAEATREVTAYNVGDPAQTWGNPCVAANGENICAALDAGQKRCAANFVPFGTKLHIEKVGECVVTDRMNRRYKNRVDIAMKLVEKDKAIEFGLQRLTVKIVSKDI